MNVKKLVCLLLVLALALGTFPAALAVPDEPTAVTVSFTSQAEGAFLHAPQLDVEVAADLAEGYGYADSVTDGVSALDVLVRAHEVAFGDDFTAETKDDWLVVSSSGSISKLFGVETGSCGFAVDHAQPHDDMFNDAYGAYGSYTVAQAPVADGELVEFFLYQTQYGMLDYYVWLAREGRRLDALSLTAGEAVSLDVEGYVIGWYGSSTQEVIDKNIANTRDYGYLEGGQAAWVDPETGALEPIPEALIGEDSVLTLTAPEEPGRYYLTLCLAPEDPEYDPAISLPLVEVEVAEAAAAPTAITVEYVGEQHTPDSKLIGKTGDTFQFRAVDQEGNETPVTWQNGSAWAGTLDENGLFTAGGLSYGGTSMLYINAASTLDKSVKTEGRFSLCGYELNQWSKAPAVTLSEDGQTAKTLSVSGGYDGYTLWTWEGAQGIAALSEGQDLDKKPGSIQFDALRPGTFTATFTLDFAPKMTDTATFTITGVAVEAPEETRGKTYLTRTDAQSAPAVQLTAYAAPERTISGWASSDEAVASVDDRGLVTAHSVGAALITATDDKGAKGGIKVVVQSGQTPYFEHLALQVSPWGDGVKEALPFAPTVLEYQDIQLSRAATTKLILTKDTLFDSEKYTATAAYADVNGETRQVPVASGASTTLEGIPFDDSTLTITLADKADSANKTVYTLHITRPRDTTDTLSKAVLAPDGRTLSATQYNGYTEGTMFRLDEDGGFVTGWGDSLQTGVSGSHFRYRCYAFDALERFSLTLSGGSAYTHLRCSTDGGQSWTELGQGGGSTAVLTFPMKAGEENASVEVTLQILDDKSYTDNLKAGGEGFANGQGKTYVITVEQLAVSPATAQILTAQTTQGNWYPAFSPEVSSYTLILPPSSVGAELRYTVSEGAGVTLGSYNATEQAPDASGVYTLELEANASYTLTVTSADKAVSNRYTLQAKARSAGAPDRVVDYLCVNSQYTNGGYGSHPENTLYGGMVSLGGFGGSITYYYEDGLRDDPAHPYGVDFYIDGNANVDTATSTKTSFFEPGQVWVSEDGEEWYALAGSAHYDDGVDWDYTVTYEKTASGTTAWTDSRGNSADGARFSGPWPSQVTQDTIALSGVLLPARSGVAVSAGVATDAYPTQWGYADCQPNGTENPYLDNASYDLAASGFDLAWAVDGQGLPIDVSGKAFHYVKVQTASNIWHPAFGEKSPEIAGVVRADAQASPVGKTALPQSVTVTDGQRVLTLPLQEGRQVYDLDVGEMKAISLSLQGAAAEDNVYLNNRRLTQGQALEGLRLTPGEPRLVRILVQNGDKEPTICVLRLTGSTTDDPNKDPGGNTGGNDRPTQPTGKLSVWFSLLGDDTHGPLDSGETPHTLSGGNLTTWMPSTQVQVSAPATALDVVEAALAGSHSFENAGGNYISCVDGLAELDNGPRSGWLYTLNGRHPDLGVAEQAVKSGDKIVLHYTDDWSLEKDALTPDKPSGGGSGGSSGREPSQQTTQTTTGPETVVFADMTGHWARDAVDFVCARGLFRGTGPSAFSPDMPMSRAMLATVLYRLEDAAASGNSPFADVPQDAWYADAVTWASSQGIVTGTGEGFAPDRDITRQELAVMLYRYAKCVDMDTSKTAKLDGYADAADVADWAREAMAWAVGTGLIQGRSGSALAPQGSATRAEVATVLQRLVERMGK